jgi:hypothetical protein
MYGKRFLQDYPMEELHEVSNYACNDMGSFWTANLRRGRPRTPYLEHVVAGRILQAFAYATV